MRLTDMTEEQPIRDPCVSGALAEGKEKHCNVSEMGLDASV